MTCRRRLIVPAKRNNFSTSSSKESSIYSVVTMTTVNQTNFKEMDGKAASLTFELVNVYAFKYFQWCFYPLHHHSYSMQRLPINWCPELTF